MLQLTNDNPDIESPPSAVDAQDDGQVKDWMSTITDTMVGGSVVDFSDDETEAGPSMTFAERQADTIKKLSMMFHGVACTERRPRAMMVTTKCGRRYCSDCIKSLSMLSTKDEGLYPPDHCEVFNPGQSLLQQPRVRDVRCPR